MEYGSVVVATRVRLARNLSGYPFPNRASEAVCAEVAALVRRSLRQSASRVWSSHRARDLSEAELARLAQDRWIPFWAEGVPAELWILVEASSRGTSVLVNEEDHIRIQSVVSGWDFDSPWDSVLEAERALRKDLRFAVSESRWGYLTASAGNVGTGLRVSAMLHLAALGLLAERDAVLAAARTLDTAIRGIHGEGSEPAGDLFQISNAVSFGRSESVLRDRVVSVVEHVAAAELRARRRLMEKPELLRRRLAASIFLMQRESLTSAECWWVFSILRLAGECGVAPGLTRAGFAEGVRVLDAMGNADGARRASRLRSLCSGLY